MMIWCKTLDAVLRLLAPIASASQLAVIISDLKGKPCSKNAIMGRARRRSISLAKPKAQTKPRSLANSRKPSIMTEVDVTPQTARAIAPAPTGKKLVDYHADEATWHKNGECLWPLGGWPGDTPTTFCCEPVFPGFPYCEEHCVQSYQGEFWR